MTKILAISDVHGEENENLYTYLNNNDIDLVLILGDITNFGPLEFVSTFINEVAFCLHNNIIAYGDAILFGFGGSNPTPFNTPGEMDDDKIYAEVYDLLANYDYVYNSEVPKVRILATHAPPFNTAADRVQNGEHVGSQGIQKSIHEFEPEINLCGHIHEAKSISKIGKTTDVANPGMLKDNGAILIDIKDGSNYDLSLISLDE